jgi:methylenetetrahydrofolate reductase (NADH)
VRIADLLAQKQPSISFEFFPPKTDAAMAALEQTITQLEPLGPDFVSVTYGAGGSTRGRTLEIARRIKDGTSIEAMAHLTCVGHTRDEIAEILQSLAEAGIENIMALRGDPPAGEEQFVPREGGFRFGSELIAFIATHPAAFCIGGAAYPEGHIETPNRHDDLRYLLEKQELGARFFVSQLFFENACFFRFVDRARRAGITVPIIAGIMPIENAEQIRRFTQRCGATIPARLSNALDRCSTPEEVHQLGVEWAVDQCQELLAERVAGLHFYTLNRSSSTQEIIAALRPA